MREDPEMLIICYKSVNVLTGIDFYMCGKLADILATEKALSVNFILSLIKNAKTEISTLRTEQSHTHHGSQFKLKISSVNICKWGNLCHTLSLFFNGPHGINFNGCDILLCIMTSCGIILT